MSCRLVLTLSALLPFYLAATLSIAATLITDRDDWLAGAQGRRVVHEAFNSVPNGLYTPAEFPVSTFLGVPRSPNNNLRALDGRLAAEPRRDFSVQMRFPEPVDSLGVDVVLLDATGYQYWLEGFDALGNRVFSLADNFFGPGIFLPDFIGWRLDPEDALITEAHVFFDFGPSTESLQWDNLQITPVPEPSTTMLVILASYGVGWWHRIIR